VLPKPPPREPSLGFLYIPPFRVQGTSIAGEATAVQVPELDICFDMGVCPRAMLNSRFVALSHGHMDHVGGLAYYCSQRRFQGMGTGVILCDARIARAVHNMLAGFVELERQKTPYELVPLQPEQPHPIKPNVFIRGFPTEHTAPSFGYVVYERRTKLRPEFTDLPQEKLRELKERGVEITRALEVPLVAFLGDTAPGPHMLREDVRKAQIVISECTFFERDHQERAKVGMHLHIDNIAEWLRFLECRSLVLVHVSRRTDMGEARRQLAQAVGEEKAARVLFLMDHRTNRLRYDRQVAEAQEREAARITGEGAEEGG
jgi:ribonuclease Z